MTNIRIGHIELYFDKGNNVKFTSLVRELECAGTMTQTKSYPFEFSTEVYLIILILFDYYHNIFNRNLMRLILV